MVEPSNTHSEGHVRPDVGKVTRAVVAAAVVAAAVVAATVVAAIVVVASVLVFFLTASDLVLRTMGAALAQ